MILIGTLQRLAYYDIVQCEKKTFKLSHHSCREPMIQLSECHYLTVKLLYVIVFLTSVLCDKIHNVLLRSSL